MWLVHCHDVLLLPGGRGWKKEEDGDDTDTSVVTDPLSGGRDIPGVFFKQYLPVSNKVWL